MTDRATGRRARWSIGGVALIGVAVLALSGCDADGRLANPLRAQQTGADTAAAAADPVRPVARDTEAPEVFEVTDMGLWDGRPSLGGTWVAHPDVGAPERVIIRNTDNSRSVVGALFRRERALPGPVFQVSSDAAAAIGMLAGAPARLQVTALRREEATPDDRDDTQAAPDPEAEAAAAAAAASRRGAGTAVADALPAAHGPQVSRARGAPAHPADGPGIAARDGTGKQEAR